jgi:hypothetical protein
MGSRFDDGLDVLIFEVGGWNEYGKFVAFVICVHSIEHRYLEGVGLPKEAPPIAPARSPPQIEFEY